MKLGVISDLHVDVNKAYPIAELLAQQAQQQQLDMLQSLTEKLRQTQGKKQIAVIHMVTAPQFTVPTERENWAYFNAFLGSSAYGQLYRQAGVRVSIMGHVHYRKQVTEGETTYLCSCLNYFSEWQSRDPAKEVAEALAILELD